MDTKREGMYLSAFAGVVFTSIGLMFVLNNLRYAEMPYNYQFAIMWFAVGALYLWNGIFDLFDGVQGIIEDYRTSKKGDGKL